MSELDRWKQLAVEVEQGRLRLKIDRAAFDTAIKSLQNYIDDLDASGPNVRTVDRVTGFGGFQMGLALAQKFTEKGGGEDSIKQRLKELQDEAKAIQDVIRKAALAYAETDEELKKQFQGIQP